DVEDERDGGLDVVDQLAELGDDRREALRPGAHIDALDHEQVPGAAPFTATGPVALFTREKSIAVTRSSSDWICPVKQSFVSKVTTAPGSTSSTGSGGGA